MTPAAIRHYERIALLPEPARTDSGYRVYGSEDVERLKFVRRARHLGLTLYQIRAVLGYRRDGSQPCTYVLDVVRRHADEIDERIAGLRRLRAELAALIARAEHEPDPQSRYCHLLEPSGRHPA